MSSGGWSPRIAYFAASSAFASAAGSVFGPGPGPWLVLVPFVNAVAWQPALRGARVPQNRENGMHALRHYYASVLLARGVDIRALATYLGHRDPGFMLRVYVHLLPDANDRARSAVDADFAVQEAAMPDGPATAQGRTQ
jgi:hypothetical protein